MKRQWLAIPVLLVMVLSSGCLTRSRSNQPVRYWTLGVIEGEPTLTASPLTIVVGPVVLPAYLERADVVWRLGEHELYVGRFDRWGESLELLVAQALASNIEVLRPGTRSLAFPWPGSQRPQQQLTLAVVRFDGKLGDTIHLDATWDLSANDPPERLASGVARIREPMEGATTADMVAAMSRALEQLAREVLAHQSE